MKIIVKHDIDKAVKAINNFDKRHLPEATAKSINITLFGLRKEMMKQLPKKLDRPTPATIKGFLVSKAHKNKLGGILFIKEFVEKYLKFQITGGVRTSERKIPIPYTPNARLNKYGNIVGKRSGLIKKKSQFIGTVKGITGVWERVKVKSTSQSKSPLKLIVGFHKTVDYQPKFPFFKIGRGYIRSKFQRNFVRAFNEAKRGIR
tara:strand:+ start:2923 stop:3534 length:612 start_codon:yes stop_codon:yes gene_type:complete